MGASRSTSPGSGCGVAMLGVAWFFAGGSSLDSVAAVGLSQQPSSWLVGQGVVAWADQNQVGEVGGAAVGPAAGPVVGVGPGAGAVAVLDPAAASLLQGQ